MEDWCNFYISFFSDIETITTRHEVVAELIEKEEVFYNLQAVIGRFLDIDHLLSLCVQVPKQENVKTAESKITNIILLKHTLELVGPLQEAVGHCENPLMKALYKVSLILFELSKSGLTLNKRITSFTTQRNIFF